MNWRIEEIEIQNFKFFRDKFSLLPEGKNVLLYGENGSGKSSIYWSLHALLNAVSKSKDMMILKDQYFERKSKRPLRYLLIWIR